MSFTHGACAGALLAAAIAMPFPARAQLLSEQLEDTRRICTYVGAEALADGQLVPRAVVVALGQECPATFPYRDPNAPAPANAMLMGEQTTSTARICRYAEGGVEYQIAVSLAQRCAVTPALIGREPSAAR